MTKSQGRKGGGRRSANKSDLSEFDRLVSEDDTLSPVFAYWNGKRKAAQLPCRDDINPADITDLLPHVGLIDVLGKAENFRYRLIGTYMVDMFGRDFTGTTLGDQFKHGSYGRFLHTYYADAVQSRAPVFCESVFHYRGSSDLRIRRLVLPLRAAADSQDITFLFFANSFYRGLGRGAFIYANAELDGPYLSENIEDITLVTQTRGLAGPDHCYPC